MKPESVQNTGWLYVQEKYPTMQQLLNRGLANYFPTIADKVTISEKATIMLQAPRKVDVTPKP